MTTIAEYLKKEMERGVGYDAEFSLEDHLEHIQNNIREGALVQAKAYVVKLLLHVRKERGIILKKNSKYDTSDEEMML